MSENSFDPNIDPDAAYTTPEPPASGAPGDVTPMPVPNFVTPLIDGSPPVDAHDTQPRKPAGLDARLAAEEPPFDPMHDTAEAGALPPSSGRWLLVLMVMAGTLCMCILLVGFAGFAGYRDGLATNDAKVTQTLATGIAQQYATGVVDLDQGYAELAAARFSWIVETIQAPTEYAQDSALRLAVARTMAAHTPTPFPTATVTPSPSATMIDTPVPQPTATVTATLNPMADPANLYQQASNAMNLTRYEDAIEWLDTLHSLDPTYRAAEAQAMLVDALIKQGEIYVKGLNTDGEDRLMRGVLLIYRADELGEVPDLLLGQAYFVESYINARNYVNGGNYAEALPILQWLCEQNCSWGYPNVNPVTVEQLKARAEQGR